MPREKIFNIECNIPLIYHLSIYYCRYHPHQYYKSQSYWSHYRWPICTDPRWHKLLSRFWSKHSYQFPEKKKRIGIDSLAKFNYHSSRYRAELRLDTNGSRRLFKSVICRAVRCSSSCSCLWWFTSTGLVHVFAGDSRENGHWKTSIHCLPSTDCKTI